MINYLLRRLLLLIPTLIIIMLVNFIIIQFIPGGPAEQFIARILGSSSDLQTISQFTSGQSDGIIENQDQLGKSVKEKEIELVRKRFELDLPAYQRFFKMMLSYIKFDFGKSFFQGRSVIDLIIEKLPVSISLGAFSTLIIYLISIPLGIRKALKAGSRFDSMTSFIIIVAYSIPSFLIALLFIIFLASGRFLELFPYRGLVSDNFLSLSWYAKIIDYLWHISLPVLAMSIGGFAGLTMLTKNSFIEHMSSQYVQLALAKGASTQRVLYRHVFRNAMLIVIAGFPATFISLFFTSSLLIEIMFSLDGLGLLGYAAVINRDYPIVFASLYISSLIGLFLGIVSDFTYHLIDPRIDFEKN